MFPEGSVATTVTVFVPTVKSEAAGLEVRLAMVPELSEAVGSSQVTVTLVSSAVTSGGHVTVGFSRSKV